MARKVALIGRPLRRPHSAVMHNAAFDHYGIDAHYELRDIGPEDVPRFVAETRGDWFGFQVTAPYKLLVMDHLDEIEETASLIGAVNSVERTSSGKLVGFNTDAPGFRRAVEEGLGVAIAGSRCAVSGAGGAARAVVHALTSAGARSVVVGNRTVQRAEALAAEFDESVTAVALGAEFSEVLERADLAVNSTTMGMVDPGAAFDVAPLPDGSAVFDLVYTPAETPLLEAARRRGLPAANGLGMLVAQAEIAFERWTGVPDAGPVMAKALRADTRTQTPDTRTP